MIDRQRLDALLDAALDLPAAERAAFLDRECETPELRAALERMLAASEDEGWQADLPPQLFADLSRELGPGLATGARLGAYRILAEIGRGGMATVYLAERADGQYEQRVAIKILDRPAWDAQAVARFHRERSILASLEHPGIARILDGGIAGDGRPWFALEHVEGRRIDDYCDEQALDLGARLRLFCAVGRAVAAAHRQLIVHRDIKPANILVGKDGAPKLLDFGIAKLAEGEGGQAAAELTRHALPMTPAYASPEQVAGKPVTTASDVYQLGLLLYELLAGQRAFHFAGETPSELREPTLTREPTRPSAVLAEKSGQETARQRGCSSVRQLRRLLMGDLDTIVLTALRPEAERRYESASRLVEDVERYLAGRPVLARPDSALYRARKFVRRNRWTVAAAAAGLLAVVMLSVLYGVRLRAERNAANRAAEKARQVAAFLTDLFRASDPFTARQVANRTAVELLDEGARRIERSDASSLAGQPEIKATMLHTIGAVLRQLGRHEEAERLLKQAVALRTEALGGQAADTLDSQYELLQTLRSLDRRDEALALAATVIAGREAVHGARHPKVAEALQVLAILLDRNNKSDEALATAQRALTILEAQRPPDPEALALARLDLNVVLSNRGDRAASLEQIRQAIATLRAAGGPEHPRLARFYTEQAFSLNGLGKSEEARQSYAQGLAASEAVAGPDHPQTAWIRTNAAELELDSGQPAVALAMIERSLPVLVKTFGDVHFSVANARLSRSRALSALHRYPEALVAVEEAQGNFTAIWGPEEVDTLLAGCDRAVILDHLGRSAEARSELERLVAIARRVGGESERALPNLLPELAEIDLRAGRLDSARAALTDTMKILEGWQLVDNTVYLRSLVVLAEVEAKAGKTAAAKAAAMRARELVGSVQGVDAELRARLGRLPT